MHLVATHNSLWVLKAQLLIFGLSPSRNMGSALFLPMFWADKEPGLVPAGDLTWVRLAGKGAPSSTFSPPALSPAQQPALCA